MKAGNWRGGKIGPSCSASLSPPNPLNFADGPEKYWPPAGASALVVLFVARVGRVGSRRQRRRRVLLFVSGRFGVVLVGRPIKSRGCGVNPAIGPHHARRKDRPDQSAEPVQREDRLRYRAAPRPAPCCRDCRKIGNYCQPSNSPRSGVHTISISFSRRLLPRPRRHQRELPHFVWRLDTKQPEPRRQNRDHALYEHQTGQRQFSIILDNEA